MEFMTIPILFKKRRMDTMLKNKFGVFCAATIISAALLSGCSSQSASSSASGSANVDNITVTAKNFEYDQKEIHVKKGDKVHLTFKSADGYHGFALPDYNVNIQGNGNADFVADKAGTFEYQCSIVCGPGHGDMKGKLIVQ
jgi:cytochrome c oxidase subunit II